MIKCLIEDYFKPHQGGDIPIPTGSVTIPTGVGNVTIPSGIKVVLVQIYWLSNGYFIDSSYVGVTAGKTYNLKGLYTEYNNGEGEMFEVYNTSNIKYWFFSENGTIYVDTASEPIRIEISWSPTINKQSPHWKDY